MPPVYRYDGKVGSHIPGYVNRGQYLPLMQQMGGRYAMIVNDWEMARDWLVAGGIPILRLKTPAYNDDDGDAHYDAAEYVHHANHLLTEAERDLPPEYQKVGIVHLGNELGHTEPARQDAWGQSGVTTSTSVQRACIFGNYPFQFAVAHPAFFSKIPKTLAALRVNQGRWGEKGKLGFHCGTYGAVWKAEDAITDGAIGGFRAAQKLYGFRVGITEFAGSLTPHDGWEVMYEDKGGWVTWALQIEKSLGIALTLADFVCLYCLPQWNVGRGFGYDDPKPESAHYKLRAAIRQINGVYRVPPQTAAITPCPDPATLGEPELQLVLDTVDLTANVREQCNTSSRILGSIKEGDIVTARPTPTEKINGYIWRALTKPWVGWVADVATLVDIPAPPSPAIVQLPVPYVTQLGVSADLRNNDCGNACAQMLALWQLQLAGLTMPILEQVDNLIPLSPLAVSDKPVNIIPLQTFMASLGVNTTRRDDLKKPILQAELDSGSPLLLLGNLAHIQPGQKKTGHWFLLVGYSNTEWIIHNPYSGVGGFTRVTPLQLEAAQTDLTNADGTTFASKPYQGFILT